MHRGGYLPLRDTDVNDATDPKPSYRLNRAYLRRTWRLLQIIFPAPLHPTALLYVVALGLALAEQLLIFNVGLIPSHFYAVLTTRPIEGLDRLLWRSFVMIGLLALLKSAVLYVCSALGVLWRELLTRQLHRKYFSGLSCYYVAHFPKFSVDNPDQRISTDVALLTQQLGQVLAQIVITPLAILYYSYTLADIMGYTGPLIVYAYFLVGVIINKLIMAPLVSIVFQLEKAEGNFRFTHVSNRVHSESAAFYRGERNELRRADSRFQTVVDKLWQLIRWQFALGVSMNAFDYIAAVLSYFLISIPILAGKYDDLSSSDLGSLISKTAFIAMYLLNSFTTMLDESQLVANIAGYTHRIGELLEKLDDIAAETSAHTEANEPSPGGGGARPEPEEDEHGRVLEPQSIKFERVTVSIPGTNVALCRDLSFEVLPGDHMIITGPSGCGKTSLTRVMLGLWPAASGSISCPSVVSLSLFYLPQKPYMVEGSLADQVVYPAAVLSEEAVGGGVRRVLEFVGLAHLIGRAGGLFADAAWDWYTVLSQGELQRLAFARLLYHQPKFAVLDEATSALGVEDEEKMYRAVLDAGVTVVSIGHRESLLQYHRVRLRLDRTTSDWQMQSLAHSSHKAKDA
eukprot:m.307438 g.307438  ORF g.307438 m.307438 type:complete len:627 (-) comp19947_c0_seq1:119-1999(-)